jgi:hypothetical protein
MTTRAFCAHVTPVFLAVEFGFPTGVATAPVHASRFPSKCEGANGHSLQGVHYFLFFARSQFVDGLHVIQVTPLFLGDSIKLHIHCRARPEPSRLQTRHLQADFVANRKFLAPHHLEN